MSLSFTMIWVAKVTYDYELSSCELSLNFRNEWRLWDNTKIVNSWVLGIDQRPQHHQPCCRSSYLTLLTWKRRDKLTSIARFWSPENSFDRIFEKFVFVLEIRATEIFVFKVSEKGRENMCSIPWVTRKGSVTSITILGFFACKIYQQQRAVLCAR